jgi:hypothetical protein
MSPWVDHFIPENSIISKVEMLHDTRTSRLIGLKFMDMDKNVLLSCGLIDF